MDIERLLRDDEPAILDEAWPAMARLEHYRRDGAEIGRARLEELCRLVARAVGSRDLDDLVAHARSVARERFEAGYALAELQAAFTGLGEAIGRRAAARLPAEEQAWALGLVGTALEHGKEALGRAWVRLALGARAPALDLTSLFQGGDGTGPRARPEEMVFPV